MKTRLAPLFLAFTVFAACADPSDEDVAGTEEAVRGQDSLDRPTDTKVDLEPGLWHDNKLVPGEGWHVYHFTAKEDGIVTFQMQAPAGHPNLWSYLRIVNPSNNNEIWASVGNKRTNLCEVIVPVTKGTYYDVIVTSQENSLLVNGARQKTDGPYTVAVSPVDVTFPE
ncbi:MAG: hypothetical protein KIT84_36855 [Labilithrix sp.]|nr:hypothetical protein [Labilithrix sp.]MCW5816627.1 hypothetical protein [Labilithrix sp.]